MINTLPLFVYINEIAVFCDVRDEAEETANDLNIKQSSMSNSKPHSLRYLDVYSTLVTTSCKSVAKIRKYSIFCAV
jgi:hypothetical protein